MWTPTPTLASRCITYSLKDGINDGFLTPFRVKQIATTLDEYVYTPDDTVVEGEIETGKRYEEADFNRIIEIKEREKKRVEIFMSADRPAGEDTGVLRHSGTRTRGARSDQPDENQHRPELLPARYRQRRCAGRAAPARFSGQ
jgi:superfamily II DNA or RNA helicase